MEAATATTADTASPRFLGRPKARFTLHYLEMLAVMFTGMGLMWAAVALVGAPLGYGPGQLEEAPALFLAAMGASMTAPMVWWMGFRGHSRAANLAMALSMIAPTVGVLALLALGTGGDVHDLMGIQHAVMLPAMLVAMLAHRDEFLHGQ